ncbi:MAG: glycoside hydrolase family 25 protein [Flavobacteriales bacterium]
MIHLLRNIVYWLLDHPQFVLAVFGLGILVLLLTKKKWRRKRPYLPWLLALAFIAYVFVFIRFYDRMLVVLRPVLKNNTQENLHESALADDQTYCFGIDISQYQGQINWDELLLTKHPLRFVIMRATMGSNGVDAQYEKNWSEAKRVGIQRGVYHFYRPFQNSTDQANHFKAHVKLSENDLPPVLDVERMSPFGVDNLRKGVRNWLKIIERHYGVKPIVYTGRHFYEHHLKGYINGYPLWIASYGEHHKVEHLPWTFYQFSEKMTVHGISTNVDGNFFKGSLTNLRNFER